LGWLPAASEIIISESEHPPALEADPAKPIGLSLLPNMVAEWVATRREPAQKPTE
jgi:hypothetical protein